MSLAFLSERPWVYTFSITSNASGGTRSFSLAAGTDAALWILTTAVAMFFILKGKVQQHRQWMTRSCAVAIVFLEVRVVGGIFGFDGTL